MATATVERAPRADEDLRVLIDAAIGGFKRVRPALRPATRALGSSAPARRLTPAVFLLVLALAIAAARTLIAQTPQESGLIAAGQFTPGAGDYFVATVWKHLGTRSLANAKARMAAARGNALTAAAACLGRPTSGVEIGDNGVAGGSAGLVFALTVVDAIDRRDLAGGRRISGTGTISAKGVIGPITDIGLKAGAAGRARVHIFLVPADQARSARVAAPGLKVVGVKTLDEAVATLAGGQGRAGALDA